MREGESIKLHYSFSTITSLASLFAAYALLNHQGWAWRLSLLLTPAYPLAPYLDSTQIRFGRNAHLLHGGAELVVICHYIAAMIGLAAAIALNILLRRARPALLEDPPV